MRVPYRALAYTLVIGFAIVLYREWVLRHQPPLFLPLGFFESAFSTIETEESVRDPRTWIDPETPIVVDASHYDSMVHDASAEPRTIDVLVTGATFGGLSAAISAAEDGASVVLVSDDNWKRELMPDAAAYAIETLPSIDSNDIARRLDSWPAIFKRQSDGAQPTNGTPSEVVAFFSSTISTLPNLEMLSEFSIMHFSRNADGRLDRALLRSKTTNQAIDVRFAYLIDGTRDGSTIAKTGGATRTSWDATEDTHEPGTMTRATIQAMAEGYTMSGRTIPGIGRRLDGVRNAMGLVDRGFHGWFVAPIEKDPCWAPDRSDAAKTPLILGRAILRTHTIGCTARIRVESSFEDTVELFLINHRNDSFSAQVRLGSGTTLNIESKHDPDDTYAFIGVFPLGPRAPIDVTLTSVLPTDRLEGIIVRKRNSMSLGSHFTIDGSNTHTFQTDGWKYAEHDIYVRAESVTGIAQIAIDDTVYDTRRIGSRTYLASGVRLHIGEHSMRVVGGGGVQEVVIVPLSPARGGIAVEPGEDADESTWSFTPTHGQTVVMLAPVRGCGDSECTFTLTESGTTSVLLQSTLTPANSGLSQWLPIGATAVKGGETYVLTAHGTYDASATPIVSDASTTADIYSEGVGLISAPATSGTYDVWIRALRSDEIRFLIGQESRVVNALHNWVHLGTMFLTPEGVSAMTGGRGEILAIANTLVDTHTLQLNMSQGPTDVRDLPSGVYGLTTFGIENPITLGVTNSTEKSQQHITFEGSDGIYKSKNPLVHQGTNQIFSLTSPWPQRIVLYELPQKYDGMTRSQISSGSLISILPASEVSIQQTIGRDSAGGLLFNPFPDGIGPVTIGLLQTEHFEQYVRESLEWAYALLRSGKIPFTHDQNDCTLEHDPSCDSRRYVRDTTIFGTTDAQFPTLAPTDARRIDAQEVLTASGAFAIDTPCVLCHLECIDGTRTTENTCVHPPALPSYERNILSISGTSGTPILSSMKEQRNNVLPSLLRSLRRDRHLGTEPTYIDRPWKARTIGLTLPMFLQQSGDSNVLPGTRSIGSTHAASRALRSSMTDMSIGSTIGHAVAFALKHEHSPLDFIAASPDATKRLQRYLIERGIMVVPVGQIENDALLMKAVQLRVLDGRAMVTPVEQDGRIELVVKSVHEEEAEFLSSAIFGSNDVQTIGDALRKLPGAPTNNPSDIQLIRFGMSNGFITPKMLSLSIVELLAVPLSESLLLKAEYLIHTAP